MRNMLFITAVCGLLACVSGAAHALTDAECREVSERYGVQAIGCDAPAAASAVAPAQPAAPSWAALRESHIFFDSGMTLSSGEAQRLALLVRVLDTSVLRGACLRLVGYSDASGPAEANLELSRQRASMVGDYLASNLADASRVLEVVGGGEQNLLPGFRPDAREHRRVAIYAKPCG